MDSGLMELKILLPYKVFLDLRNVRRVVAETSKGFYGFLPHRLDCVAALVPGLFVYETESIHYIAVDAGLLVKTGTKMQVSVRNAIAGADLGKLHKAIQSEFLSLDENEKDVRSVMAKMEGGLIRNLAKFRRD